MDKKTGLTFGVEECHLTNTNAEFDGNIIQPLVFCPTNKGNNLLTTMDEPYSTVVKDLYTEYINSPIFINGIKGDDNSHFRIPNWFIIRERFALQLLSIIYTNINIIFDNGILKFLNSYNTKYYSELRDLYIKYTSSMYDEIRNLITVSIDIINPISRQNDFKNMIDSSYGPKIQYGCIEYTLQICNSYTETMYRFINHIMMNGTIDVETMNLDILTDFQRNTVKLTDKQKEAYKVSAVSMCIQYAMELLTIDMGKIQEMVTVNYLSTMRQLILDYNNIIINN